MASQEASFDDRDGWIWFDGKLVPWREADVHILTHGLQVTDNDGLTTLGLTGLDGGDPGDDSIGTEGDATFVFTGNPALVDPCEVYILGYQRLVGASPETDFTVEDISGCKI